MNVISRKYSKTWSFAAVFLAAILITVLSQPAAAQRPSLSGIDAKLDQLLSQGGTTFDASRYVTIRAKSTSNTSCLVNMAYVRFHLDGSEDSSEFAVPNGFTLLISEVNWNSDDGTTDQFPGRLMRLELSSVDSGTGASSKIFYYSPSIEITTANQESRLGTNEVLRTGAPVGEGRAICPLTISEVQNGFNSNRVFTSILRGVLVPNAAP